MRPSIIITILLAVILAGYGASAMAIHAGNPAPAVATATHPTPTPWQTQSANVSPTAGAILPTPTPWVTPTATTPPANVPTPAPPTMGTWGAAATLTATGMRSWDDLGYAVALSADGSTLAIGAPNNAGGGYQRGAVEVYTRPAGGWATSDAPAATLTTTGGADGGELGWSLALSADGGTLVIGAPGSATGGTLQRGGGGSVHPTGGGLGH